MKQIVYILFCLNLISCATNTKTRWALMGAAAPVGAAVGYSTALKGESKEFHAVAWAAVFTAIAAVIGNTFYNDDKRISNLESENEKLKVIPKLELISQEKGIYKGTLNYSGKKKVKLNAHKADKWIPHGKNKMIHVDIIAEKEDVKDEKK
jgi:hypothetical protein